MSIREDRSYLAERKAEREALNENAEKQRIADFNEAYIQRDDLRRMHEAKLDRFYNYKDDVKKTLLKEALVNICEMSMRHPSAAEKAYCENLVLNYIEEVGTSQLLKNMKFSESALLVSIQEEVEEYLGQITSGATADDPESQVISRDSINDFWKEIDKSDDIDDITSLIRMRVANAEEEFVNKNKEDKENVNRVLKNTAARVNGIENEEIEESESNLAKDKIYQIQHEGYHNVFDRMVRNLSEATIKNEDAKKNFMLENGRLNVEKIVECARCMYTLLEVVSTLKIENVDNAYIEESIKSIK